MQTSDLELGYLAEPGDGPHPGVVLIHDVWGLSDHTRDVARRLAGEGFRVLAIDLYRRQPGTKIEDPARFMRELDDSQVLTDLQAGVDHLARDPATARRAVAVLGFCMGGMYALLAAGACRGLSAAVVFYGLLSHSHGLLHDPAGLDPRKKPLAPLDAAARVSCPLLGLFGEDDAYVPPSDVERLRAQLSGGSKPAEVVVYPGAGHAFMNDTRPDAYRPEIARQAWARTLAFLRQELR